MRSPTTGIHDLRSVNNDDNENHHSCPARIRSDHGTKLKAVPITTDNEINFRVDRGDYYALCHPNGTCSFPDGECVPNAAAAERLCEQDAMKVMS